MNDVTVVMGALPGREKLREVALQSVLMQSIGPVPVRMQRDVNGLGCGAMKNLGLEHVTTTWTAFLDDDDWYRSDHLAALLWASPGADLVYSRPIIVEGEHRPKVVEAWPDIPFDAARLRAGNYIPCGYMVRTDLARAVGGFPERTPEVPYSDWGFLLRLLDADAAFSYVPDLTWAFRRWSGNTSSWRAPTSIVVGQKGD